MLMTDPRLVVSVVSVWASQADAESETNRLDRLGSTKGIRYSWQYTKLYEPSKDPGAWGHVGDWPPSWWPEGSWSRAL